MISDAAMMTLGALIVVFVALVIAALLHLRAWARETAEWAARCRALEDGNRPRSSMRCRSDLPDATGARISGTSLGRVAAICSIVPGHSTSPSGA